MKKDNCLERRAELAPLDVIRVETVLSRYPIHRLAKTGTHRHRTQGGDRGGRDDPAMGDRPSQQYGQPGPLAYKLDTLVVNRRIEEPRADPSRGSSAWAASTRSAGS